jgi:SAM-dependent methyltransferase
MEVSTYAIEAQVEATHWWFTERRRLLGRMIAAFGLPADARILDIGTSTGTNLRMLRDLGFSRYEGLDMSDEAVRWCADKGYGKVTRGDACALPFPDASFDLILATDIIEHVDDDALALREMRRVLKPDGRVLVTVPAFPILWGLQDEIGHHKRRYRAPELVARIRAAGLAVQKRFYFNYLLFVPILLARRAIGLLGIELQNENQVNSPLINRLLTWVFRFDVWTAPVVKPPFGVSWLAVAVPQDKGPR